MLADLIQLPTRCSLRLLATDTGLQPVHERVRDAFQFFDQHPRLRLGGRVDGSP